MEKIVHKGIDGVFLSTGELEDIRAKLIANNALINKLIEEVGLNEQTI